MKSDVTAIPEPQLYVQTFDAPLGRRVIDTHIWAVREGLRGASAYDLFDGYCQRLVVHGVPLWRAHAAMETLHPQWSGYGYTWRRDLNAIQPEQYARSDMTAQDWLSSPMYDLIRRARLGEDNPRCAGAWRRTRGSATFPCWMNSSRRGDGLSRPALHVRRKRRSFARHRSHLFLRGRPPRRFRR